MSEKLREIIKKGVFGNTRPLNKYRDDWQKNAEADPFWAILVDPKFYNGKWDVADFFATGDEEINRVFKFMEEKSIPLPTGSFLDFGCGVGRVSKALRKRLKLGYGVDIAPKMVELACQYVDGVDFIINQSDSLSQFKDNSIDFIYSHVVLQHIPNQYQEKYIREFLRILKPGGLAVFQIPIELINPKEIKLSTIYSFKTTIKRWFPFLVRLKRGLSSKKEVTPEFKIEMHVLSQEITEKICKNRRCIIECSVATNSCDADHDGKVEFHELAEYRKELENSQGINIYLSCMYFVRKPHTD